MCHLFIQLMIFQIFFNFILDASDQLRTTFCVFTFAQILHTKSVVNVIKAPNIYFLIFGDTSCMILTSEDRLKKSIKFSTLRESFHYVGSESLGTLAFRFILFFLVSLIVIVLFVQKFAPGFHFSFVENDYALLVITSNVCNYILLKIFHSKRLIDVFCLLKGPKELSITPKINFACHRQPK